MPEVARARQGAPEAPQVVVRLLFAARGGERGHRCSRAARGVSVMRLMAPPLPAASQPSKTARHGTCFSYMRKCSSRRRSCCSADRAAVGLLARLRAEIELRRASALSSSSGQAGLARPWLHQRAAPPRSRCSRAARVAAFARAACGSRPPAPPAAAPAPPPCAPRASRRPCTRSQRKSVASTTVHGAWGVSVFASISSTASTHLSYRRLRRQSSFCTFQCSAGPRSMRPEAASSAPSSRCGERT